MNLKNRIALLTLLIALFSGSIFMSYSKAANKKMSNEELVKRGTYLVELAGCNDCHSPKTYTEHGPVPNADLLLSGHPASLKLPAMDFSPTLSGWSMTNEHLTAWVGPWGVSYAANITPDKKTGIGNWTPEIFIKAMRTGKHMGEGRPILPPMPWFNMKNAPEEDLRAIFAYLQSIKPIQNLVPPAQPPAMSDKK